MLLPSQSRQLKVCQMKRQNHQHLSFLTEVCTRIRNRRKAQIPRVNLRSKVLSKLLSRDLIKKKHPNKHLRKKHPDYHLLNKQCIHKVGRSLPSLCSTTRCPSEFSRKTSKMPTEL